ncbi:coenzyme F420 hydrogenase beta subunit FrhB2 [Methanobrevibacter ruminantium M1]|uniref:Coenzyme F420 hydrogenase beta subunit FrhB2 n=1 Tax=Methanobrevibacter ruminantium (strain ATCC 35063 / DSM 1093 / JCM 13430 / OCM 146 / M1) TaxID=634498 RepID=D3E0V7_METRM|nr:Coenzyme F420 hydrogenase/dehydrogenase, beta subunit C-terminal domain [Methanobrevibacter ruminantium]ADC47931.1 coenzyme F420 hydrogenase beta subunit FrhB2 [Methanobrevibacter ruminantium M1]
MSEHKIAMVGTPCEIMAASKLQDYTDSPIEVKLGLFCMENFSYKYFVNFLKEYDLKMDDIEKFQIDKGFLFLILKTKETVKIPLSVAKRIIRKNCNICVELTSETSDISIGSIGSDDGWSTLIVRSEKGEEIVKGAIEQRFIEVEELEESKFQLLNKLAQGKINRNLEHIEQREFLARPVLYQREKDDDSISKEISESDFSDLKSNVIDIGACVLCGACEYACPDNLIIIDDTKPRMKGQCPPDCHACFAVCPRTFIEEHLRNDNEKPIGDYINVYTVRSLKHSQGQDGSIVTTILDYLLSNEIVTEALIVDKKDDLAWKPYAKLTKDIDQVVKSGGTKYSVCPVFKPLKEINEESSTTEEGVN